MNETMRVLLMADNWGGLRILNRLLEDQHTTVVGIVFNDNPKDFFVDTVTEINQIGEFYSIPTMWNRHLKTPLGRMWVNDLQPDVILCVHFKHILRPEIFDIPIYGSINLHPSYLPVNAGWHPNEYPIIDGSIAGWALHYISKKVDTGDLIMRGKVPIYGTDTGRTLYDRIVEEMVYQFNKNWLELKKLLVAGDRGIPQSEVEEEGNYHSIDEIKKYNRLTPSQVDVVNILRARTYPPYTGCYFMDEETGKKVYVWVDLFTEDDVDIHGRRKGRDYRRS